METAIITTAIITGALALIGAYIGASVQRKAQHQTWLLEKRAEVFAKLLTTLDRCMDKAESLPVTAEEDPEIFQKLIDIYAPALLHVKIARLFLMSESKEQVEELIKDIWSLHISRKMRERRTGSIAKKLDELQSILEKNLLCPAWNSSNRKIPFLLNKLTSKMRQKFSKNR